MSKSETPWYLRRKLAFMDLRLERLTLERAHLSEFLELLDTVDAKERPFTFDKKKAEMELRHWKEMAELTPRYFGPPRNVPHNPNLVSVVHQIVIDNPGISRKGIVEKLDDPRTDMDPLTNVLTTLRRRGSITNCGTRKSPEWHPSTN